MQDNNEAGASPALVERALEDCRTWQALPDANGAAHVLAAEVERLRSLLALHDSEDATAEAMLEEVQRSRTELDRLRKIERAAREVERADDHRRAAVVEEVLSPALRDMAS